MLPSSLISLRLRYWVARVAGFAQSAAFALSALALLLPSDAAQAQSGTPGSGCLGLAIAGGDNQSGPPNTTLPQPLTVQTIRDPQFPSTLPVDIVWTVISGNAGFGALGATSVQTSVFPGQTSSVNLRLGDAPGSVLIDVRSPACGAQLGMVATIVPPTQLAIVSGNGQVGRPGLVGQPLVVSVTQGGSPVVGATVNFAVQSGSVTLGSASATTDSSGRAQTSVTFGPTPGTAVVEASTSGAAPVQFSLSSSNAVVTIASGNQQQGVIGTTAALPLTVDLEDSNGVPLVGEQVSFQILSGGGTLSSATAVTDSAGRASVRLTFGNTPGPVQVRATALGGSLSVTFTATALAPQMSAVSGQGQTGTVGTALPSPLVVAVSAPDGTPVPLANVAWTVLEGGGSLASASTQTDTNGRSQNTFTLGTLVGTQRVQASVSGGATIVFTATGSAGTPTIPTGSVLEIVSGNNQNLPTNLPSAALVVRLRNAQGQGLANIDIAWGGAGGAVPSSTQTRTGATGETSITAMLQLPIGATVTARVVSAPTLTATFTFNGGVRFIDGLTPPQQAVAAAIDSACPALFVMSTRTAEQNDLLGRCSELVGSAGPRPLEVIPALDQMLADEAGAQGQAAFASMSTQFDNLKARMAALRGGARFSMQGLALQSGSQSLPLDMLAASFLADPDTSRDEIGSSFERWGFFATGTIGRGDQDGNVTRPGFDFDTQGVTAGVDYRFNEAWVGGVALGYNRNDTEVAGGQGSLDTNGYSLSAYGSYFHESAFYADAVATLGRNDYDAERRINYSIVSGSGITLVDQIARAASDGDQRSVSLSFGKDFNRGNMLFGPYLRGSWTRVDLDGYSEVLSAPSAPGGGLGVVVEDRELKSLTGVLGGKLAWTISTGFGVLMPSINLEYQREFEDDPERLVTRFLHDPTNTPIILTDATQDDSYFNIGLGISAVFTGGRSGFLYYERAAGLDGASQDNLALGIRIEF